MSTHSSAINALASSTVNDILGGTASLGFSRIISFIWAIVLIIIALMFDAGNKAIVMVGLEIASFTYGGLLGLFLLSKSNRHFHTASLATGLVASMAIVFVLKHFGLAWTWYIFVSVTINIIIVFITDMVIKEITLAPKIPDDKF
jgi:solute:Na+ symporter, SSS family